MPKRIDIAVGSKFDRLLVIGDIENDKLLCQCDCGKKVYVKKLYLLSGNTRSCGCLRVDNRTKLPDLTGKKVGRLTVIKFDRSINRPNSNRINYWICQCDCGNMKSVGHRTLTKRTGLQSCGCLKREALIQKSIRPNAGFNKVYRNYTNRCTSYNIQFTLSVDEFYDLTQQKCHYCGIEPFKVSKAWSGHVKPFVYNGIDRVDSSIGYTVENCVACCTKCNYAKGDMSASEFKEWLLRAYKHLFKVFANAE